MSQVRAIDGMHENYTRRTMHYDVYPKKCSNYYKTTYINLQLIIIMRILLPQYRNHKIIAIIIVITYINLRFDKHLDMK